MKKPMRKVKKFAAGGEFSAAQEEWLGKGADRTDPFILARMRKAVPDEVKTEAAPAKTRSIAETKAEPAEVTTETNTVSKEPERIFNETGQEFKRNPESGALYSLDEIAKPAAKTVSTSKPKEKKAEEVKEVKEVKTEPKKGGHGRSGRSSAPSFAEDKTNPLTDAQKAESKSAYAKKMEAGKSQSPLGRFSFGDNKFSQVRAKNSMAAEGNYRKGGVTKMAGGGKVKSASARADGCAIRGKTRA
jgi:hypothetical protein